MGALEILSHPDTVLTAAELETLADGLLSEIPIGGVEAADPGIIRQTLLEAAVTQTSLKAVTDSTRGTYSDDYTLAQLHTISPEELESVANALLRQQAAMILGLGPRIICLDFSIFTTTAIPTGVSESSVTRLPAIAPQSAIL